MTFPCISNNVSGTSTASVSCEESLTSTETREREESNRETPSANVIVVEDQDTFSLVTETSQNLDLFEGIRVEEEPLPESSHVSSVRETPSFFETSTASTSKGPRLFFHSSQEIPQLKTWFQENNNPSEEILGYYAEILNQTSLRKERQEVTVKSLKNWWKNERAKIKKKDKTQSVDSDTDDKAVKRKKSAD